MAFDAGIVDQIYLQELRGSKFMVRRIMMLEFSQYLVGARLLVKISTIYLEKCFSIAFHLYFSGKLFVAKFCTKQFISLSCFITSYYGEWEIQRKSCSVAGNKFHNFGLVMPCYFNFIWFVDISKISWKFPQLIQATNGNDIGWQLGIEF